MYGAENWTLWEVEQKYLESFEIWCKRRMEKIIWTDRVKNKEGLYTVKEERNILHTRGVDKSLARPTSRYIFLMVRIFHLMLVLLYI